MMPILLQSACDLNNSFNWGQIGTCLGSNVYIGTELSFFAILLFFVLIVLFSNLRIGVWYAIAGVVVTFFLRAELPNSDVAFMIWVFVIIIIPVLMFIPSIKKFIDR